jgi:hypothetical protein
MLPSREKSVSPPNTIVTRSEFIDEFDKNSGSVLAMPNTQNAKGRPIRWSRQFDVENAKICLPLGITTKSDFVFAQPRPTAVKSRIEIPQRNILLSDVLTAAAGSCERDAKRCRLLRRWSLQLSDVRDAPLTGLHSKKLRLSVRVYYEIGR